MWIAIQTGTGNKSPEFLTEVEAKEWGFEHYNAFETREIKERIQPIEVAQPVAWKTGIAKRIMDKIIWGKHWEINEIKDAKLNHRIIV